jgi:predicted esterase
MLCFQLRRIVVKPDSNQIMLNQYIHTMKRETMRDGDEIYIALADLVRILSPNAFLEDARCMHFGGAAIRFRPNYRTVEIGDDAIAFQHTPFETANGLYIPVAETMTKLFREHVCRVGSYLAVVDGEENLNEPFDGPWTQTLTEKRLHFRFGKTFGDRYFTIWVPEASRLNVYRMYIPSGYEQGKPRKLLVCLHGGGGNSDTPFIRSGQKLQYYAEKYGYILLAPNSYVHGSNYGGVIPPVHMFPESEVKPKVPAYYSDAEVKENQIAQGYFTSVLNEVLERWSIDREHIFVTGNSMGSVGCFHALSTWPELFRAGAPTAVMPLTEYLDVDVIKEKPILFMAGTEDANDPADMYRRYGALKAKGCDIRFQMIGGGYHADAWVYGLKQIFRFFETF